MPRPEASAAARSLRQWPLLIVVIGVLAGLVVSFLGESTWRLGCLLIGASLGVGAVERIALPSRDAGLLQVRTKAFDVTVLAVTGAAIIALAIVVPEGRWLRSAFATSVEIRHARDAICRRRGTRFRFPVSDGGGNPDIAASGAAIHKRDRCSSICSPALTRPRQ